jgi:hypothetical protein
VPDIVGIATPQVWQRVSAVFTTLFSFETFSRLFSTFFVILSISSSCNAGCFYHLLNQC